MAILKIRDDKGVITNIAAIRGENGKSPIIKNGTWWTYDDELEDYIDTGLGAEKESNVTKENVEKVLTGTIDSHNHDNIYVKEAPSDSKQYVRYNGEWSAIDLSSVNPYDASWVLNNTATEEQINELVDALNNKRRITIEPIDPDIVSDGNDNIYIGITSQAENSFISIYINKNTGNITYGYRMLPALDDVEAIKPKSIDHIPTEDDTEFTFLYDNNTMPYPIGSVVYHNDKFYRLNSITDGKADWRELVDSTNVITKLTEEEMDLLVSIEYGTFLTEEKYNKILSLFNDSNTRYFDAELEGFMFCNKYEDPDCIRLSISSNHIYDIDMIIYIEKDTRLTYMYQYINSISASEDGISLYSQTYARSDDEEINYDSSIDLITRGDGTKYLSDNGEYQTVIVPTKVSELTNDSGYLVSNDISNLATKDEVATKVDKVSGKGLSTNDYTTDEKNKLAGIAVGAEVNVNADWNATSGDAMILNKPSIPSKTSELTNDSDYITSSAVDTKINSAVASVYRVRGSVDNYESLPSTNVIVGDVYNLLDTGANYACISIDPIIWDKLSETIDLSAYSTTEENDAKYQLKGDYITSIPDEYVTDTELEAKGYATATSVEAALATKLDSSAYTAANSTTSGYMSSEDYNKLASIEENADVNIIESITVNGDAVNVTDKTAVIEVNETHGVLLNEVPTDTTLTYQDGDKVKVFTIGMTAIYPDDDSEDGLGISFFKGIDSEGNAIWGVGGGGVSSEKVSITLDTNQADKSFLVGTEITVAYGEITSTYTWEGTDLTVSIPANFTYTISTAEDTNNEYAVINSGELTAVAGATRTVTIYRNTTVTSFTVSRNNSYDWAFPSDITVTLTGTGDYSSYSKVLSGALTYDNIKIPTNTTYNVTVSNLDGTRYHYIAPTISTKTASNPSESVSIDYVGRTLTINHSTTEDTCSPAFTVSYSGVITNSDSFTPTLTSTSTSTLIVLPDNTNYSITGDENIEKFEAPTFPIEGTINSQDVSVSIVYSFLSEEVYASWVIFDDSSSTTVLETGGNADIINSITANFKRCIVKPQSDGSAAITYLNTSNSNYFADGSSASSYTSNYNWMVHFPKYYYRCEQDSLNTSKWKLYISDRKINDNYKEERECLIGIFEAYNSSSRLYSRPNVVSTASLTITDFFTCAQANGTNWGLIDYRAHKTIANMFACKYGNTNISTSNSSIPCSGGTKAYNYGNTGNTLSLGNTDGLGGTSSNFLGLEDCYYGKWEFVQGINIVADRTWVVYDGGLKVDTDAAGLISSGYTNVRTIGTGYSSDGWITGIAHGEYADVMPTAASGGSDLTYYADYYYQNTGNRIFHRSGGSDHGSRCGVFYSNASNTSSDADAYFGSRLGFYGTINVYDTDAWKAL